MLTKNQEDALRRDREARGALRPTQLPNDKRWEAEVERADRVNGKKEEEGYRAWSRLREKVAVSGPSTGNPVGEFKKPTQSVGEGCRRATIPLGLWRGF